jgi:hypothetical protein
MPVQVSVIKNKNGRKMLVGQPKLGRYATAGDFTSHKHRLVSSYILPGDGSASLHDFPKGLALKHLLSHRGARTSLRPRHR